MDSTLSMSNQVHNICKAGLHAICKIGSIRKYLDSRSTEILVHAFVTSRLDCCNSLLYGLPAKDISKIQRVQNTAARLVVQSPIRQHITPVPRQLHWLPVTQRITFKILLFVFKALHNSPSKFISELIQPYVPKRSLRSRSESLLAHLFHPSTKFYGNRSFSSASVSLWNALPIEIRQATSTSVFKSLLKTHLFNL
ncbi:uncharacterized protein [Antedon mediterranea]|uniref:uncharacterized protein n=1 Tax=Antedon mediterranea TaxID=105859 RepID=UPI003AF99DC0